VTPPAANPATKMIRRFSGILRRLADRRACAPDVVSPTLAFQNFLPKFSPTEFCYNRDQVRVGHYPSGHSGNPNGRPPGSRNKRDAEIWARLEARGDLKIAPHTAPRPRSRSHAPISMIAPFPLMVHDCRADSASGPT
jgi:hypothetical protein